MKINKCSDKAVWVEMNDWLFYIDTSINGEQAVSCYKKGEDGTLDKTEGAEDVFLILNTSEGVIHLLTDKEVCIDPFLKGESNE